MTLCPPSIFQLDINMCYVYNVNVIVCQNRFCIMHCLFYVIWLFERFRICPVQCSNQSLSLPMHRPYSWQYGTIRFGRKPNSETTIIPFRQYFSLNHIQLKTTLGSWESLLNQTSSDNSNADGSSSQWIPLLQVVTVPQGPVDELVGRPLEGEVFPGLVERQVPPQHLHLLLLQGVVWGGRGRMRREHEHRGGDGERKCARLRRCHASR